jgi:hypothetical protein
MGKFHWKRSRMSPAEFPMGLTGQTLMARFCPVERSRTWREPP